MSHGKKLPKLCIHKAKNLYYIRLAGKIYYLGKVDGSPEAEQRAERERLRILNEYQANGAARTLAQSSPTIAMLALAYARHAGERYRHPDGRATSEVKSIQLALRPLVALYGSHRVADFSAEQLEALQRAMATGSWLTEEEVKDCRRPNGPGWCRNLTNANTRRIQRMFTWGLTRRLVPAALAAELAAVPGLRAGQFGARETAAVMPAPADAVEVVRGRVNHVVRAMIDVQLLTAARPGEVCSMRPCDIDRTGKLASQLLGITVDPGSVWIYLPGLDAGAGGISQPGHKTAHHGIHRFVPIGPRAQEVLRPFLEDRAPDAYLFSPAEGEAQRDAERRANRKTPLTPSQRARRPKANPQRAPRDRYDPVSYAHAIAKACRGRRARPAGNRRPAFSEIPVVAHVHPNQFRHTAATEIERTFGAEVARIVCGHQTVNTTEIYVARDLEKAFRAMEKFG
jgi:integrase